MTPIFNEPTTEKPKPKTVRQSANSQTPYTKAAMTNADIFETMEKEMKQIMELFAKERKSRKKELTKLQAQVDLKNEEIVAAHKEKEEIMKRWQEDSEQHK